MTQPADLRRRRFVQRAAYVAPAILTLAATPAYAKSGSEKLVKIKPDHPVHPAHPVHSAKPGKR